MSPGRWLIGIVTSSNSEYFHLFALMFHFAYLATSPSFKSFSMPQAFMGGQRREQCWLMDGQWFHTFWHQDAIRCFWGLWWFCTFTYIYRLYTAIRDTRFIQPVLFYPFLVTLGGEGVAISPILRRASFFLNDQHGTMYSRELLIKPRRLKTWYFTVRVGVRRLAWKQCRFLLRRQSRVGRFSIIYQVHDHPTKNLQRHSRRHPI